MKVAGSPTLQETQKNTQNGPFKIPSSKRTTQTHANSQKTQTDRYFFFGGHAILPKGETFSATCFSEMGELFRFKKKIRLFRTPTYYLLFLIVSSSFFFGKYIIPILTFISPNNQKSPPFRAASSLDLPPVRRCSKGL